jgi:hypothetical protein
MSAPTLLLFLSGSSGGTLVAGSASFVSSGVAGIVLAATPASGGNTPYNEQWQRSTNGVTYTNLFNTSGVTGVTTLNLTDNSAVIGQLYYYRMVVTDSAISPAMMIGAAVTAQIYLGGAITTGITGLGGGRKGIGSGGAI